MRRFVTLDCLVDSNDVTVFSSHAVQNLRRAVLAPAVYQPRIQQALQRIHFNFHRTCSYTNLIRECDVGEGQTLLMFWGSGRSESRVTVSMSASSCSSIHTPNTATPTRDREQRHAAQQTDITCRYMAGMASPVSESEDARARARLAESLTSGAPSPPGAERSRSILGSVCALLLAKQASQSASTKEVTSVANSIASENICRICFGGASAERLERPCGCRGTIAAVHRSCLERWLLQAATSYCELCRHHYVVTRSHKWSWSRAALQWAQSRRARTLAADAWRGAVFGAFSVLCTSCVAILVWSWMRSVVEWARSGRARALAADAWRGAALGAASVLGTARALHACDRALQAGARRGGPAALAANLFSSLLIGVIGALNGLLTTWMLLKIQEHQLSWQAWRDSTLHVRVTLADERDARAQPSADAELADAPTVDRSTNVADPFMVALPYTLPEADGPTF